MIKPTIKPGHVYVVLEVTVRGYAHVQIPYDEYDSLAKQGLLDRGGNPDDFGVDLMDWLDNADYLEATVDDEIDPREKKAPKKKAIK